MIKTISLIANEEQKILVDKYNVKITNFTSSDVYVSTKPNISADKDDVKKILSYQSDGLSNLFDRIFFIKSNADGNVQFETADDMSHFFKYQNMAGGGTTNTYTKSEIDVKFNNVGYSIGLSVDPLTYVMTLDLKNSKGDILSTQNVDLPIESMIVSANYENGMLNLILQSGETLNVDISSIINGLVNDNFTIAGIDMKDDITADELRTALNITVYDDTGWVDIPNPDSTIYSSAWNTKYRKIGDDVDIYVDIKTISSINCGSSGIALLCTLPSEIIPSRIIRQTGYTNTSDTNRIQATLGVNSDGLKIYINDKTTTSIPTGTYIYGELRYFI